MERKLRFLHSKLGAVMKGYKTRRIFHNNKIIRKYRQEFREIIQFAYQLKQDIDKVQGREAGEHIRTMLVTSLKDLVNKKQQFSNYFGRLLRGEERVDLNASTGSFKSSFRKGNKKIDWLVESQPRRVQQLVFKDIYNYTRVQQTPKTV